MRLDAVVSDRLLVFMSLSWYTHKCYVVTFILPPTLKVIDFAAIPASVTSRVDCYMKRQRQIDESKDMIADAFVRLMHDHDFHDLTLSQIAEAAGVNRMTLYRHFRTKERIVLYCAQKTLKEQSARNAEAGKLPRDLIRERLEWIQGLPQLHVLMQSRQIQELLDEFQVTAHLSALERFFGTRFHDNPNLFHFYFGGVNRIVKEWLLGQCRQSAAEITDSIVSLTFSLAKAVQSGEGVTARGASG